jgi:hypothetical protein
VNKPSRLAQGRPSHMSAQDQVRKQSQSRPVIQPKMATASRNPKQPVAPPPYRPQQANKPVQPQAVQMRRQPVAPQAYRPQPTPKVLQTKKAHDQISAANLPQRKPVAPPVYRPQHTPNCLQAKIPGGRPAQAYKSPRRPVAPPVYRPQAKKIVQPKSATIQRVLELPDQVEQYAQSIHSARNNWHNLTDSQRTEALRSAIAPMFGNIGVSPPKVNLSLNDSNRNGEFNSTDWSMDISERNLKTNPTALAKTLYHEARHAEQSFMIARYLVQNNKPFPPYNQIPDHVIESARKTPPLSLAEGADAMKYYESFYGSSQTGRKNVLSSLAAYSTAIVANRKKAWEDAAAAASQILEQGKKLKEQGATDETLAPIRQNLKNAREIRDLLKQHYDMDSENRTKALKAYFELPEEVDAHARGDQVEQRLKEYEVAAILSSELGKPRISHPGSSSSAFSPSSIGASSSPSSGPHAASASMQPPVQSGLASSIGPTSPQTSLSQPMDTGN